MKHYFVIILIFNFNILVFCQNSRVESILNDNNQVGYRKTDYNSLLISLNLRNSEKISRYDSVYIFNNNEIIDSIEIKKLINDLKEKTLDSRKIPLTDSSLIDKTKNIYDKQNHLKKKTINFPGTLSTRVVFLYDKNENLVKVKCKNYYKNKVRSTQLIKYKFNNIKNLTSITEIKKGSTENKKEVIKIEYEKDKIKTYKVRKSKKYEFYTYLFK